MPSGNSALLPSTVLTHDAAWLCISVVDVAILLFMARGVRLLNVEILTILTACLTGLPHSPSIIRYSMIIPQKLVVAARKLMRKELMVHRQ